MFTLSEIIDAKPAISPISTGTYWENLLLAAEKAVKFICRRNLEADVYTETGWTLEIDTRAGIFRYFLREPTGTALTFSDFEVIKLNGVDVAEGNVKITANYLEFSTPGKVEVKYPGGYCRNSDARRVLMMAVIEAMHILHRQVEGAGIASIPVGSGTSMVLRDTEAYANIRAMLAPYIAPLWL